MTRQRALQLDVAGLATLILRFRCDRESRIASARSPRQKASPARPTLFSPLGGRWFRDPDISSLLSQGENHAASSHGRTEKIR